MSKIIGSAASVFFAIAMALSSVSTAGAATSVPFQKYINGSCPGLICTIDFPAVAAGKRLEISSASCYIRLDNTSISTEGVVYAAQLISKTSAGGIVSAVTLVPHFVDSTSTYRLFSSSDQVVIFAGATQHIQAYVQLGRGSFLQVACSIGGQLVTL